MTQHLALEFAIVGHPNEGKSAVVSTLAEDDSVSVSSTPGETKACREFPVTIDGREMLRFIDTPGFQKPRAVLKWMSSFDGDPKDMLLSFLRNPGHKRTYPDECQLLSPLSRGAGIIYVADGSRPVRSVDIAEMSILRLTGRPRLAVLNCKDDSSDFVAEWEAEFMKHFNGIRRFNALKAQWVSRIDLLESLNLLNQQWQARIGDVVSVLKKDWEDRISACANIIYDALSDSLTHQVSAVIPEKDSPEKHMPGLTGTLKADIIELEQQAFSAIRDKYRHRVFNISMPPPPIINQDLFSKETWEFLGLSRKQIAIAGGVAGGSVGAVVDTIAHGLTFGIFTSVGSAMGAGTAFLKSKSLAQTRVAGVRLGGRRIQVGPVENPQFPFVFLDRAFIFFAYMVSRPHGRRDSGPGENDPSLQPETSGITRNWSAKDKHLVIALAKRLGSDSPEKTSDTRREVTALIRRSLEQVIAKN